MFKWFQKKVKSERDLLLDTIIDHTLTFMEANLDKVILDYDSERSVSWYSLCTSYSIWIDDNTKYTILNSMQGIPYFSYNETITLMVNGKSHDVKRDDIKKIQGRLKAISEAIECSKLKGMKVMIDHKTELLRKDLEKLKNA